MASHIIRRDYRLEKLGLRAFSDRCIELASPEIVKSYIDGLRNLLNQSSLPERRAFVRSFAREVRVTGDEVLLTYTIPMPPKGISQEAVGVPPIVHYSGRYSTIGRTFQLLFSLKDHLDQSHTPKDQAPLIQLHPQPRIIDT